VPEGFDASKVKAKMSKGVLKVEVPKSAAKAQQVKSAAEWPIIEQIATPLH